MTNKLGLTSPDDLLDVPEAHLSQQEMFVHQNYIKAYNAAIRMNDLLEREIAKNKKLMCENQFMKNLVNEWADIAGKAKQEGRDELLAELKEKNENT